MKKPKPNYYKGSIEILLDLKKNYSSYSLGLHLSTALGDYGDLWGVSDKEIHFALTKYRATLEMDVPRETVGEELDEIMKDAMDLKVPDRDFTNGQDY